MGKAQDFHMRHASMIKHLPRSTIEHTHNAFRSPSMFKKASVHGPHGTQGPGGGGLVVQSSEEELFAPRSDEERAKLDLREKLNFVSTMKPAQSSRLKARASVVHVNDNIDLWYLHQMASELSMSLDDVMLVKRVFDSFDSDGNGSLDVQEFEQAVVKILRMQLQDDTITVDRVKSISEWYWWDGETNSSGSIDFREFLKWYCSNGFSEGLLLTEQETAMRRIAKQYGLRPDYVDMIKRCFDAYDTDHSGEVDINEFKQVLYRALKVPPHLELPQSRITYFWSQIDTDASGTAAFEEFLEWWLKYFDEDHPGRAKTKLPFEDFYKQVRRMGAKYMDPLIYPPG